MFGAVACAVLLALPFVPGAEIGLAMLAAFGPVIAPLIYVCTVASMILAYTWGAFFAHRGLVGFLSTLRMRRHAFVGRGAFRIAGIVICFNVRANGQVGTGNSGQLTWALPDGAANLSNDSEMLKLLG